MRSLLLTLALLICACGGASATAKPLVAGQTARVGDLVLTYDSASVRTFAVGDTIRPPAGQQWIDVEMTVTNRGHDTATIADWETFTLIDARGQRYPAPSITITPNPGIDGPLPAGESVRGTVVFGTPTDTGPYRLRYTRLGTTQTATWAIDLP